jgi:hypothetical protein
VSTWGSKYFFSVRVAVCFLFVSLYVLSEHWIESLALCIFTAGRVTTCVE